MRRYSGAGLAPSRCCSIVLTPINDEQCSVRSIYSIIRIIQIIYIWSREWAREKERERKRERERAKD
jgi:hypothetical protein